MVHYSFQQPIRFPDVDHAGIAFFGALLTYCHYAQEEWLERINFPIHRTLVDGWAMPIVKVDATFSHPAKHGDTLRIDLCVERLGGRSMRVRYDLFNETVKIPTGNAIITQVCTEIDKMSSMPFPVHFRETIEGVLKQDSENR
jgi:YbgC/YbaW family acyl-CoA thioester hydrolase